jgi:hypothetical protein
MQLAKLELALALTIDVMLLFNRFEHAAFIGPPQLLLDFGFSRPGLSGAK